jgi:GDP-L-fucose synthase
MISDPAGTSGLAGTSDLPGGRVAVAGTAPAYPLEGKRVWVAGHGGMVGRAIVRRLARENCEILTADRRQVDLRRQQETEAWLDAHRPQAVFVAAARVGGIVANDSRPAEFLYDNLAIEANVIEAARRSGVEKLLFLGSSCIYPREAAQPMAEDVLLTGPLEPTNEAYAIAKIAGIKLCQAYRRQYGCDFISAQPTNLYGPFDNFDLTTSHVIPALMAKAHRARTDGASSMTVWGSGAPLREFLYVDDLADALCFLMQCYSGPVAVNVGTGEELSIATLARSVADAVGFAGALAFDASKPDGTPRKLLDCSFLHALGWRHMTPLHEGLCQTYAWFCEYISDSS